ncbi:MAG: HPr family phosphocarrier protein [Sulfurovaceae bacterium]|nr:HPr family phosphocarrier protein [Sulfurovaceae bacterium]
MKSILKLFAKTHQIAIRLNAPYGVHLRPSAMMAGIAKKYSCQIMLNIGDKQADVKNMNAVLALGLQDNDEIVLEARGKDALEALRALGEFLSALAAKEDDQELKQDLQKADYEGHVLQGTSICGGVAVGVPYLYEVQSNSSNGAKISFDDAYQMALEELESLSVDNDIFRAQKSILESISHHSHEEFIKNIDEAVTSLKDTANQVKIADYQDIKRRVTKLIQGVKSLVFPKTPFLLIANELLPGDIPTLIKENIQGVIVKNLPPRAHAALLLRSYKIPAISLEIASFEPTDNMMILDGSQGLLVTAPTKSDLSSANNAISAEASNSISVNEKRFEPAITKSGKHIKVLANITDVASAQEAKDAGCEGIGLLRTEFLFRETKPTFDEQVEAYRSIFTLFDEVTVRTLDIGGDKKLPYLTLQHEENPFLGVRGIRLFETHLELMEEQLLAILKAKQNGELKVMFPMVATVDEFNYAKSVAHALASKHSVSLSGVSFGIMVEVPSVLFLIEEFNKVVDFYSIGTNDLAQYLFAIDRTHATLTVDPHSNVLYDAIKYIQDRATKPVSTCGEIASNCDAIEKLVNIGINTLGVTPAMIPTIKARIRDV